MLPKRARMNSDDQSSLSASYLDESIISQEEQNDPSKTSKSKKTKRKKKAVRKDTLARDAHESVKRANTDRTAFNRQRDEEDLLPEELELEREFQSDDDQSDSYTTDEVATNCPSESQKKSAFKLRDMFNFGAIEDFTILYKVDP